MPRRTDRQQRSENLIKTFVQFCKLRAKHLVRRARRQKRFRKRNPEPAHESCLSDDEMDIDSFGPFWPSSSSATSTTNSSESGHVSTSESSTSSDSYSSSDSSSSVEVYPLSPLSSFESLPPLEELLQSPGLPDLNEEEPHRGADFSDTSSSNSDDGYSTSGEEGDDEDSVFSEDDVLEDAWHWQRRTRARMVTLLGRLVHHQVAKMYKNRYEVPRRKFPRGPGSLCTSLTF